MANNISVGNLKNIRSSQGLSQSDLARRVKMSSASISTMEKKGTTSSNTAEALARELGVTIDLLKEGPMYRHGSSSIENGENGKKYPPVRVGNEYSYFDDKALPESKVEPPKTLESSEIAFTPVDGSKRELPDDKSLTVTLSLDKEELKSLIRDAVAEGVERGMRNTSPTSMRTIELLEEIATKP